MDLVTFEALLGPHGQDLLRLVSQSHQPDLALATRLRTEYDPSLVAAAMTTRDLRIKAATKFGDAAAVMYFTSEALEQATRADVAHYRAQKARERGISAVIDLGCGIGSDLIAFAKVGISVRGIDRDDVRVAMAKANIEALGLTARLDVADAREVEIADNEIAFIDPARRDGSRRTFQVRDMEPDWDFVVSHLQRGAIVKTMPGISHGDLVGETEWISHHGDLVETCLWGAGDVQRIATVLPSDEQLNDADSFSDAIRDVGAFIYEPDDAVIRAGLVQHLAEKVNGWRIDEHLAYVSSNDLIDTVFARGFEIIEELPFHTKALARELNARNVGTLTVKKRGVEIIPEQLIKQLKLRGSESATVIMTRVFNKGRAFLVKTTQ